MDLTIHNARLDQTGEFVNLGARDGLIVQLGPDEIAPGEVSIDAHGAMLSPPLIDSHFHLENSLLPHLVNESGSLWEAIRITTDLKKNLNLEDISRRAAAAIFEALPHGTLWIRNHVEVEPVVKTHVMKTMIELKKRFENVITIQNIAFPQYGLAKNAEAQDLVWEAMEIGADIVGGIPHAEKTMDDAARQIEILFEIAQHYDRDLDLHVDETDDPYWHSLELLAEKTIETGYQGRVTAGHCCSMAAWDDAMAARVITKVKDAGISVVTNTPVNLLLQGRDDPQPVRRGITRVKELLEAGVNVSCGQDAVQNMFYPYGQMDMLEVANIVGHAAHLSSPSELQDVFDMPRHRAAKTIGLQNYGLKLGNPADMVLIEAKTVGDALRKRAHRTHVIRGGKVLIHSTRKIEYGKDLADLLVVGGI
jgi:cytosine/creatinine deaminase